jgi:hypothetical protein
MSKEHHDQALALLTNTCANIREALSDYLTERAIVLNNEQLFTFVFASVVPFAVALDDQVDKLEQKVLLHYSSQLPKLVRNQFSTDTLLLFSQSEPKNTDLNDFEFTNLLRKEALYIIQNHLQVINSFAEAIKHLLHLEDLLLRYNPDLKPLSQTIFETMFLIMKSNSGNDADEEHRLLKILGQIGIPVTPEAVSAVAASLSVGDKEDFE